MVNPDTLTDNDIRIWRSTLTCDLSELSRQRYDCVLALGGDSLREDSQPRDLPARARICDAINARSAKGAAISSERIGAAPRCHQDPSHSSAWCAVHDEVPDWHSEMRGYVGPAGFVCHSGGMVFDDKLGEVALAAHNKAMEASAAAERKSAAAALAAERERVRQVVRDCVIEESPNRRGLGPITLADVIADRVADELNKDH